MDFSDIRRKISKIDSEVSDLKTSMLAEMAVSGENPALFKFINMCAEIQDKITTIKNDIQDSEIEEEEMMRESWEKEQQKAEEEFYTEMEGNKNV